MDDLPDWLHAKPKPVLAVPYTVELNDIPMMAVQYHRSDEMYHRGVLQLDRLWRDAAKIPVSWPLVFIPTSLACLIALTHLKNFWMQYWQNQKLK